MLPLNIELEGLKLKTLKLNLQLLQFFQVIRVFYGGESP
jgi:hypothetical protein